MVSCNNRSAGAPKLHPKFRPTFSVFVAAIFSACFRAFLYWSFLFVWFLLSFCCLLFLTSPPFLLLRFASISFCRSASAETTVTLSDPIAYGWCVPERTGTTYPVFCFCNFILYRYSNSMRVEWVSISSEVWLFSVGDASSCLTISKRCLYGNAPKWFDCGPLAPDASTREPAIFCKISRNTDGTLAPCRRQDKW